jgi:hypothetical protein
MLIGRRLIPVVKQRKRGREFEDVISVVVPRDDVG